MEPPQDVFGHADGGVEGKQGFIKLSSRWGDLALDPGNLKVRILVGRRGAGKSRYLRAMEREANSVFGGAVLTFPQRDESVWISEMRWLHRIYSDEDERIETWRRLWGCAVYTSLATYLINYAAPVGTSINLDKDDRDHMEKHCADHLGQGGKNSFPIVAVLNQFLKRYSDRSRLDAFLALPEWVGLEQCVLRAISATTPVACYIDTLDDTFAAAPAPATDCQVGLLLWMMKKFVDPHVSNRLHLVITVRDTIFAKLVQSEHGRRYNRSDLLRCLDWTEQAATDFLYQKVQLIPNSAKVPGAPKWDSIANWLGFDRVPNAMRGGTLENVSELIVRHTRFLPREIIEIGNAIGRYVQERLAAEEPIEQSVVAQIVMNEARRQADLALDTATDHMMALDSQHDTAVVDKAFRQSVAQAIMQVFIPALQQERFTREVLTQAERAFYSALGGWTPKVDKKPIALGEILWLHGLIGFEDRSGPKPIARYFSSAKSLRSHVSGELPKADHFYLHSALLLTDQIVIGLTPPRVEAALSND